MALGDIKVPKENSQGTFDEVSLTRSDIGAAGLDSPAFTGTPTAPTASAGTNTTQIATTAFTLANRGDRYLTTSTSSHSITTGSKTFTVQSGLSYTATQDITIVYDGNPTGQHMHGVVTSYSGTTLVVNVESVEGSGGPFTAWTINVGGLLTAQGALLEANNLSDVANPATALTNIGGVPTSRSISAGTGLTGGGNLTADRTLAVSYGSSAGTACEGNDARLSDSRTPLSHSSTHHTGGTDAIAPSSIGAAASGAITSSGLTVSGPGRLVGRGADAGTGGPVQEITITSPLNLSGTSLGLLSGTIPTASSATPSALGVAAAGTSANFARADHVHAMPSASDIGAMSQFVATSQTLTAASTTLAAGRARRITLATIHSSETEVLLPVSGNQDGDIFQLIRAGNNAPQNIVVRQSAGGANLAELGTTANEGRSFTFRWQTGGSFWAVVPVDTHTHTAAEIVSGTLDIARIPTGTGSTQVALGNHTHADATTTVSGFLSASDKTKLDGIASGAEANVQANWTESNSASDAFILNKPTLGTAAAASTSDFAAASHTHTASAISDSTTAGRALLTAADATSQRTSLGLADIATSGSASDLGSGTVPIGRLGASGTPSGSTYLAGDNSWKAVSGVTTGSVDNAVLRADGTGGSTSQNSDILIDDATTTTQNNVAIRNNHSQSNSAVVIQPKGDLGFILGPKPDGTATGGNARGTRSVDLLLNRNAATQVASGPNSFLAGGLQNTASGFHSGVICGFSCSATNSSAVVISGFNNNANGTEYCIVAGGRDSTASGSQAGVYSCNGGNASNTNSIVLGGGLNTASGVRAAVLGGSANTASGQDSSAFGERALADRLRLQAHASGMFAATGDAQRIRAVLRCKTTDGTTGVEMALDGNTTYLTIPSGKVMYGEIYVVGVRSTGADVALYTIRYAAKNVGGTSTEVFSSVTTDAATGTSLTITTQDTGDYISIKPVGVASQTWRWVAKVDMVEVAYGT